MPLLVLLPLLLLLLLPLRLLLLLLSALCGWFITRFRSQLGWHWAHLPGVKVCSALSVLVEV